MSDGASVRREVAHSSSACPSLVGVLECLSEIIAATSTDCCTFSPAWDSSFQIINMCSMPRSSGCMLHSFSEGMV